MALFSLIGILFAAVIGLYVWTFRVYSQMSIKLAQLYSTLEARYVPLALCEALHQTMVADVKDIKVSIIAVNKDIKELIRLT